MAGSDSKYKDSFISQEDLDTLMKEADDLGPEAFSGQSPAAEQNAAQADDPEEVISQDDINALLNLADGDVTDSGSDDGEEVISQDDIDALLAGNTKSEPPPDIPVAQDDDFEDDTADLDLVSPEDIEKLLKTEDMGADDAREQAPPAAASDLETITQEDLKDLSSSMEIKAEATGGDDDDDSLISQDDIDALLSGNVPQDEPEKEEISPVSVEDSGGDGEDDSLISQDDIDRLLAGADGDEESAAQEPVAETAVEPAPEPVAEKVEEPEKTEDEDANLISQEDIDKLLIGKSEEVESEETLIDQDDIDRLLSSSAPLDEDRLAGQGEQDKLISQEDIDKLLNEDFGGAVSEEEDKSLDQVILEQETDPGQDEESGGKAAWYRSKLFISSMAMAIVLVVSAVVMTMFTGDPEAPVEEQVTETEPARPEPAREEAFPLEEFTPRTYEMISVTMTGFVVPAPAQVKGLAYIALDLTFEISDAPTNPIKDYEPFFRNIVYEVLNKAFILQSESKIVEADLKNMIRNALNDALSEGSVTHVEFMNFKVG